MVNINELREGASIAEAVLKRVAPEAVASTARLSSEALDIARSKFADMAGEKALAQADSILDSVKKFAERHTEAFPQVSNRGELQYGFAGSLGSSLTTTARSMRLLDASALPEIKVAREVLPTTESHLAGLNYVRKASDVDYTATEAYLADLDGMNWGSGWSAEKYQKGWSKKSDVDTASGAFKTPDEQNLPYPFDGTDHRSLAHGDNIGVVDVNGKSIFVVSPDTALAYKFTQGMRTESMSTAANFARDIDGLLVPAQNMFSRKELVDKIADKLFEPRIFDRPLRDFTRRVQWTGQSADLRELIADVAQAHPDFKIVENLPAAKGFMGLDYVHAISRMQNPAVKEGVASWIGTNRSAWKGRMDEMFRMIDAANVENPLAHLTTP